MKLPRLPRLLLSGLLALFLLVLRIQASTCTISPANPVAGQTVTVTYDKTGGPLAASANILIHRGINNWSPVSAPDERMTRDPGTGLYTCTYVVPEPAYNLSIVFNGVEMSSTWDNNGSRDWYFDVQAAPVPAELPAQALLPTASKAHVMMQGFYWDVPAGGTWYNFLASKAAALRNIRDGQGLDRIWFPPPCKSDSGQWSMGYDPYDYYDLGAYFQKGTTATRFGTQAQLKSAISAYHDQGILVLADIVPNHRGGGANELNPNTNTFTYTDFRGVASGKATWTYNQFHPSTYEFNDDMSFSGFADVCLAASTPNTVGWPRKDIIDWLVWLRDPANAGFDGWRLDLAQGYRPSWINDLRASTSNAFAVMEKWDGNTANLEQNVKYSGGTHTFDFAAFYTMRNVCISPGTANIADLVNPDKVYAAKNPAKAVTFVENHDTDKDPGAHYTANKMLSYAFILTYQGYPCLFWRDYFDYGYATLGGQTGNGIDALVWARGALAGGNPVIENLKTNSSTFLIYGTSNGTPTAKGYVVALNSHGTLTQSAAVTTTNPQLKGKALRCYAWYSHATGGNVQPADVTCDANGQVTVQAPPLGYAVYGPANLDPGSAPSISTDPVAQTGLVGATVTFTAAASGSSPTLQWQRKAAGGSTWADVTGAISTSLAVSSLVPSMDGDEFRVVATNGQGSATSAAAKLTVSWSRIANMSVRIGAVSQANPLIMGFVSKGGTKSLLSRAWGPVLGALGVANTMEDPVMELHDDIANGGAVLAQNDNWGTGNVSAIQAIITRLDAYPFIDVNAKDSALLSDVNGTRTLYAFDKTLSDRITLLELYDVDDSQPSRLVNFSARNEVGTGDNILVAGFSIKGNKTIKLLIRGIGPKLADWSVPGPMADPTLVLHRIVNGVGTVVDQNDNWASSGVTTMRAAFTETKAFDLTDETSKDAAMVVTLAPGLYTVSLSGKNLGTGNAMIEVYEMND